MRTESQYGERQPSHTGVTRGMASGTGSVARGRKEQGGLCLQGFEGLSQGRKMQLVVSTKQKWVENQYARAEATGGLLLFILKNRFLPVGLLELLYKGICPLAGLSPWAGGWIALRHLVPSTPNQEISRSPWRDQACFVKHLVQICVQSWA